MLATKSDKLKIHEIKLYCTDLKSQKEFYSGVLGFRILREDEDSFTLDCGQTQMTWILRRVEYYYHFAWLIPVGALEACMKFLKERNIVLLPFQDSEIIQFDEGRSCYFYDPNGNIAEFIERPVKDRTAAGDFSIGEVICLNEISLPNDDPQEMAEKLISEFGIEPINPGRFDKEFCWVGNWEGVFLSTIIGRNWLPTEKPGLVNDMEIRFSTKIGNHSIRIEDNKWERIA